MAEFVTVFGDICNSDAQSTECHLLHPRVFNGMAGEEIRRLVPLSTRRELGAFFTPHELADDLVAPLRNAVGHLKVLDPCCGAGDLLLAATRAIEGSIRAGTVTAKFLGVDKVEAFSLVARMRFEAFNRTKGLDISSSFGVGDGLGASEMGQATHVLLNPPYASVLSHKSNDWAQGRVNGAADFVARTILQLNPGTEVLAILPDVLRSGSRYMRWRKFVSEHLELDDFELVGRFDPWTDVDVFVLRGKVIANKSTTVSGKWVPISIGPTISDRFDISVGPLVDYREPRRGPSVPYLAAKEFPAWHTVETVKRRRKYCGRLIEGPIVVIPRTSRAGDPYRARCALVTDPEGIAVENHLLVLKPKSGGIHECRRLARLLRSEATTIWLDTAIRCRHLTVGAIGSIPWIPDEWRIG